VPYGRCSSSQSAILTYPVPSKRHHDPLLPPKLPPADPVKFLTGIALPWPPDLFRCLNGFVVWTKEESASFVIPVSTLVDVFDSFAHVIQSVNDDVCSVRPQICEYERRCNFHEVIGSNNVLFCF